MAGKTEGVDDALVPAVGLGHGGSANLRERSQDHERQNSEGDQHDDVAKLETVARAAGGNQPADNRREQTLLGERRHPTVKKQEDHGSKGQQVKTVAPVCPADRVQDAEDDAKRKAEIEPI